MLNILECNCTTIATTLKVLCPCNVPFCWEDLSWWFGSGFFSSFTRSIQDFVPTKSPVTWADVGQTYTGWTPSSSCHLVRWGTGCNRPNLKCFLSADQRKFDKWLLVVPQQNLQYSTTGLNRLCTAWHCISYYQCLCCCPSSESTLNRLFFEDTCAERSKGSVCNS